MVVYSLRELALGLTSVAPVVPCQSRMTDGRSWHRAVERLSSLTLHATRIRGQTGKRSTPSSDSPIALCDGRGPMRKVE